MTQSISGRCLCGAVQVKLPRFDGKIGACHCGMCRRWNGGPSMSINGGTNVQFFGEDHIRRYSSSDWAERGFCERCGTHLFYHLKVTDTYYVWAGLFDDLPGAVFAQQIYVDHKPDWYAFANETHTMTEADVIASANPGGN